MKRYARNQILRYVCLRQPAGEQLDMPPSRQLVMPRATEHGAGQFLP
jgi:hypothetical protein